ncbi:TadE/TadG family type IV pilus assembly protein [Streptomyces griseorubiginosus]|uniref:TadE/TadG family type IV pilus assembly protein n=1 Tax=Streptomyces griseorubiginosus TaxID=67304 RepID=UPI0036346710
MRTSRFPLTGPIARAADDRGQVTPFITILAVAIVMFVGLIVDGGLALAAKVRAIGEAQEAARAGAQALDLAAFRDSGAVRVVPGRARALAQSYLGSTGDAGTVTVNGDTVTVTVTAHQGTQLLGLLGVDSLTVTGTGSAHPVRGVLTPEP